MNKKVLSAILFSALFAGTGTFTSCIDNDEPAGIEELRGAKAELIRAKVAVQQANAAFTLAQAEVEKAKAAKETALAKIEEANAEAVRLANELLAARNEAAKAQIEAELEAAKLAANKAKLEYEAEMLDLQAGLAEAQRQYDITMKQIEIAKALMNEGDLQTIADLEGIVEDKQDAVADATDAVKDAENDLYEATMAVGEDSEYWVSKLELDLKYANANLEFNKDLLTKYQNYVENLETADWLAEIKELEVELDSIEKAYDKLDVEETKDKNSEEFKAQVDTLRWAEEAVDTEIDTLGGLKFAEAVADTLMYFDGGKDQIFSFEKDDLKFRAVMVLAGRDYLNVDGDFTTTVAEEYEAGSLIADLNAEIASYTTEYKYWLDSIAANDSVTMAGIKADADSAIVYWQRALAAYNAVDKTIGAKYEAAYAALYEEDGSEKVFAKADDIKTAAKAVLDYLTVAKKNGAKLNNLVIETTDTVVVKVSGVYQEFPVFVSEDPLTVLADAKKAFYAYKNGVNFLAEMPAGTTPTEIEEYGADEKLAKFKDYKYAVATDAPEVGVYDETDLYNEETLLGKLQKTSYDAFGEAAQYVDAEELEDNGIATNGYLHKQPTAADAKYVGYDNAGAYGTYLASLDAETQFVAKNYEAIIADLQAAVTKWTALVDEIVAEVEAACADINEAIIAHDAAEKKFEAYVKAIEDKYAVAKDDLGGKKRALETIKEKLAEYVNDELENGDYEDLESWLADMVKTAEYDVIAAEEKVLRAENNIQRAKDGKYATAEALADAKEALDEAMTELEKAQAELEEALANLATALEIMAAE